MNTELQNQIRAILLKELKPGGMLYAILERGLDKPTDGQSQSVEQNKKNKPLSEQVNAKLERVKELNNKIKQPHAEDSILEDDGVLDTYFKASKTAGDKIRAQEKTKEKENLLEYMVDRESIIRREYQKKYETTLLGLVDLVERFGGDSGAMMNWNSAEFVKNAKPEEVIENVYKALRELEEDAEQRVAYSLANKLIESAKSGTITSFDVMMELKKYFPQHNVTLLDGELIVA